ncbi:MAG: response regulator [Desulfuromonadaceae bacterium]|nr:response regulator [Desulfuromonadaceae bacterium]MDD5106430.1 response regulator [Desulfuromonadaceae bacterium]
MTETDKIPILLVDDRPENLIALENLLDDPDLAIFTATSGNEALRLSLKHDFAIVLMDVRMPDMDGFETAELMRTYPKTSRLPIIFVSAVMKDTRHQFKGYESGAFDYLMKPFDPTILRSKVRVFCDLYQQRQMLEIHEQQLEIVISERTAELNRTLDNLRENERHYRELLASVTSYMYTVVMEGGRAVSTTHGPGCLKVTGFSAGEYAEDPELWCRMIHPEDRQAVINAAQRILISKSADTLEHRIQHKDGSFRWVQTTLVPRLSSEGQLLSYDGVINDITERKQAEEALNRLNEELEQRVGERTKELERRNHELEQMNKAFVGRELKMVELKGRIKELENARNQGRGYGE